MRRILLLVFMSLICITNMSEAMNFSELVKNRQSVRSYLSTPVEREKILTCLESTRLSPSANNAQPWRFIIVDDATLKNEVADAISSLGMNKFAKQAPVIVVVVLESRDLVSTVAGSYQKKDYSSLDLGIAVHQFCLQATDLGLGSCIIGWFNEKRIKELLNIPKGKRVTLVLTLGYSDAPIREKQRKTLEEISNWNKY